jgi:hypothetical protein
MTSFDPRVVFEVWLRLISDEELYDATIAGRHAELFDSRNLGPIELAILDDFSKLPGTRWNIENLRFRAAAEAAASLVSYLPRTIRMLTNGDPDWLQEIAFEYLAHHHWKELGHFRYSECERFAAYAKKRIFKRRVPPAYIEAVLDYELAVIALYKKTAGLHADAFASCSMPADDEALARLRLRPAPASAVVDLPVNLIDWIKSGDPSTGAVTAEPISLMLVVPSLSESHRIFPLGEGARGLYPLFSIERTAGEVAVEAERSFGFPAAAVYRQARKWVQQQALVA